MPHLTLPSFQYKTSFLAAIQEYQAEGLASYLDLDVAKLEQDFPAYLDQLQAETKGERLPPGFVPHTVFWLVEGDEYLGRLDIRHQLNYQLERVGGHIGYDIRPTERRKGYGHLILELGTKKAKELGLAEVLITCDVSNLSSNKIIQQQGGQLLGTQATDDPKVVKNRYRIELR